jgi:hypothetical protein
MRDSQIRFIRQLGYTGTQFPDSFYSALMFQPRVVGGVVALGVLLQSAWPFLALSAALWLSTWFPSLNPFDAIYNHVVAYPRGLQPLGAPPPPRRFAQGMAGTVAMAIGVALLAGTTIVAWVLQGMLAVASMAAVFRDSCAGADAYYLVRGAGRQPADERSVKASSMDFTGSPR